MNTSSILIECGRSCFAQGSRFNIQANFKGCDYEAHPKAEVKVKMSLTVP
jgi:hypothetical protein